MSRIRVPSRATLTTRLTTLLVVSVILSLVSTARARSAAPGEIGVFGDPQGTMSAIVVNGFQPFNVYVVAFAPPGGLQAYEFGLSIPEGFTRLGQNYLGQGPIMPPPDSTEWIVQLATCFEASPLLLLTLHLGYFAGPVAPHDITICVGPSSAPGGFPHGSFTDCEGVGVSFDLVEPYCMTWVPDGCLVLNYTGASCPTEETSFTGLKTCYRPR